MANEDFDFKIYNFVLLKDFADSVQFWGINNYKIRSPSFSTLVDHLFGVIWHVFAVNMAELICLNRADLYWALRFLEAIDISRIADPTDINRLILHLRKIILARYELEDDPKLTEVNTSLLETTIAEEMSTSALEDIICNAMVQDEIRREKRHPMKPISTCTDEEIIQRLKQMNPNIKSIQDILDIKAIEDQPNA